MTLPVTASGEGGTHERRDCMYTSNHNTDDDHTKQDVHTENERQHKEMEHDDEVVIVKLNGTEVQKTATGEHVHMSYDVHVERGGETMHGEGVDPANPKRMTLDQIQQTFFKPTDCTIAASAQPRRDGVEGVNEFNTSDGVAHQRQQSKGKDEAAEKDTDGRRQQRGQERRIAAELGQQYRSPQQLPLKQPCISQPTDLQPRTHMPILHNADIQGTADSRHKHKPYDPFRNLQLNKPKSHDPYEGCDVTYDKNGRLIPIRNRAQVAGPGFIGQHAPHQDATRSKTTPSLLSHPFQTPPINENVVVQLGPNDDFPSKRMCPPLLVTLKDPFIVAYTSSLKYVHVNSRGDHRFNRHL